MFFREMKGIRGMFDPDNLTVKIVIEKNCRMAYILILLSVIIN